MVRELTAGDAEAYVTLRRAALVNSPRAFASSLDDDLFRSPEAVREQLRRKPHATMFGAFRPELVGIGGMYRDARAKSSHKAHVWGMYVVPNHRRRGIGIELLEAMLRHARKLRGVSWVHVSVTSAAPEARLLYERLGFRVWGTEPAALCHDGQTVVEYHLALCLERNVG